jgi:hypothetical protein
MAKLQLNKLEFSWGMRRGTLNVDTRLNIFRRECRISRLYLLWKSYMSPS